MIRHFLDLHDLTSQNLQLILNHAHQLKRSRNDAPHAMPLAGRSIAMIFEKNSTRTRVSFEVGIRELGANPLVLLANDLQLGRGETIADTARVLSRYVHAIMMRATLHEKVEELARCATIPIINGLTDRSHPCQIMADLMTIEERLGTLADLTVLWAGDGNNVLNSWISAAAAFGFHLRMANPPAFRPHQDYLKHAYDAGAKLSFHDDIMAAAKNVDVVVTDTWVSMGHEHSEMRRTLLSPYQVNDAVMQNAAPHALFLHCLPAHRGEEVTASVLDGTQSAVWDEAENRLHVQKAIMLWCLEQI
ncbi:MAG: ornithine carbamoyltransferase [Alphaproteobacteria bacterium]|nr:MAG: ornithine carbamoyltransferase [Alphaproteobacteria bacterium]TAF74984.1 MAG: ornithine carbamoyltransferase [Alphaproteobacteria bacterium]